MDQQSRNRLEDEENRIMTEEQKQNSYCNTNITIPDKGESPEEDDVRVRGKSDTAQDDQDDESHLAQQTTQQEHEQHFMESMIQQYTSLVEDLSRELFECQEYIKLYVDSAEGHEHHHDGQKQEVCKTGSGDQTNVSLKEQIRRKDAMIVNLQKQLEISHKTSNINKSLWQSSICNIETLETQKSQLEVALRQVSCQKLPKEEEEEAPIIFGNINACQHVSSLPSDFLTKWKLLQTYSESLENRLAKSASERNFYRSKMLDIRLEYETALKRQAAEKAKEIEHVKASYAKEIEYLKSCVDKLRQQNKAGLEKRLEAEKETWEYQEHKRLQSLKIHVENLIMENELLRQKQLQYDSILRSLDISSNADHGDGGDRRLIIYQGKQNDVAHAQVQCNFNASDRNEGDGYNKRYKSVQTELYGAVVQEDKVKHLKTSQHQLELEYKRILVQLNFTEATAHTKATNLEERIHQLESLNAQLQSQIMRLNEANAKLVSQSHQIDEKPSKEGHLVEVDAAVSSCTSRTLKQIMPDQAQLSGSVLMEEPEWSKPDDFLMREKYKVDSSMWKLKMSRMQEEMSKLESERDELLSIVEEQQNIVNQWKREVKRLVQKSIEYVAR